MALPRLVALDLSHNNRIASDGVRALSQAISAGAWPHMPPHRRDPRGKAWEGQLRGGIAVPSLDGGRLLDELLVARQARREAAAV